MEKPYFYIRYRWLIPVDFEKIEAKLKGIKKEHRPMPYSRFDLSILQKREKRIQIHRRYSKRLLIPFKAVLYQTKPEPFTSSDLRLREIVLQPYPRVRGTALTNARI
ncbi:MAG: hypothetical protein ACOC6N_01990, partial [archaeon]